MPRKYIISTYLLLASIILSYFLAPLFVPAQGLGPANQSPQSPPAPKPITQSEWPEKRSGYLTLYNSNSVDKRLKAIDYINTQLFERLVVSDMKYASEVMEFILQVITVDKDERVIKAARDSLAKFLADQSCIAWVVKNHRKIAAKDAAKLGLIGALSDTARTSLGDNALSIAIDLTGEEQSLQVRLSAITLVSRGPSTKSIEIMLSLARDNDAAVCRAALSVLAGFKPVEKASALIKMLGDEKRADIRDEIGRALEAISGQKFGADAKAWQKWWDDNPLNRIVRQEDVDAAISRGVDYLVSRYVANSYDEELVLYTLVKSRVKIPDATLKALLDRVLAKKLDHTYRVALQALALSDLDGQKYQDRIVQCAEFLIANQSTAGNWHYGKEIGRYVNTPSSKPAGPTDGASTRAVRRVTIKMPPRRSETDYDNSCTQYALLGLRACADAYIEIPQQVWVDAEKHLLRTQDKDGGWNYVMGSGYGSMTAGGLGALAICKFYLNKDIKDDKNVKRAMDWLAANFTVRENPKYSSWHYYYLYALERAGIFANTELFGNNEWYPIGANYLLNEQKPNGSWGTMPSQDTCFAILFLRRATKPLKVVITPGGPAQNQPGSGEGK
ncbi:MAG: HEAT repeat domain-containing protein [Planctomycetota bacterium]